MSDLDGAGDGPLRKRPRKRRGRPSPLAVRRAPLRLELRTRAALDALAPRRSGPTGSARVARLLAQDPGVDHWALDYAARLVERVPGSRPVVIQTSMSPSGRFHVGNFRDSVTAFAVARAVEAAGRRATILLSFDDYDPGRNSTTDDDASLRPQADGAAAHGHCKAYLAELAAVGILGADTAGGGDGDHDGSGWPRWVVHHQAERYRRGEYEAEQRFFVRNRATVARLLGRTDPDRLFRTYCPGCGANATDTTFDGDEPRYRCDRCGAAGRLDGLGPLKPAWMVDWMLRVVHEGIDCEPAGKDHCAAGSTMDATGPVFDELLDVDQPVIVPYGLVRQFTETGRVSGSAGGGLVVTDLLGILPAPMILWLYLRDDVRADFRLAPDLAHLNRWYRDWDRFRLAAHRGERRALALWGLLSDDRPDTTPLPGFRRCCGLVQSSFYDVEAAAARLEATAGTPIGPGTVERLGHALAWLARWGNDRSWFHQAGDANGIDGIDGVDTAVGRGRLRWDDRLESPGSLGEAFTPEVYHGAAWALWGTTLAPPLSRAVDHHGADTVAAALTAFRTDGSRPLRAAVERRLDALPHPEAP